MGWITRKICEFIYDVTDGLAAVLVDYMSYLFGESTTTVVDSSQIQACVVAVQSVATVLVSLMVVKQLLSVYILETDGDVETDPLSFLVKASVSLALVWTCPVITSMLIGYAGELYSYLSRTSYMLFPDAQLIREQMRSAGLSAVVTAIFGVIYVVSLALLVIKAAFRGVELGIMEIIYPIFCVDIITTSQERWKTFFSSYLVVIFGYIIQLLCIQLSMYYVALPLGGFWIALAFLFFAVKAPNWLEKFAYASGAGRSAAGTARSAMYMLPMLRRR